MMLVLIAYGVNPEGLRQDYLHFSIILLSFG
jgi:hypothetical protein